MSVEERWGLKREKWRGGGMRKKWRRERWLFLLGPEELVREWVPQGVRTMEELQVTPEEGQQGLWVD